MRFWLTYIAVSVVTIVPFYFALESTVANGQWFIVPLAAFIFFPRRWLAERLSGSRHSAATR